MSKDHVSEQYVKQIETSAKDFLTAMKKLDLEVHDSPKWKTQSLKCKVAHEHFEVLVEGFDKEYKKTSAPDKTLKELNARVGKAEKSISIEAGIAKNFK